MSQPALFYFLNLILPLHCLFLQFSRWSKHFYFLNQILSILFFIHHIRWCYFELLILRLTRDITADHRLRDGRSFSFYASVHLSVRPSVHTGSVGRNFCRTNLKFLCRIQLYVAWNLMFLFKLKYFSSFFSYIVKFQICSNVFFIFFFIADFDCLSK